MIVPSFTIITVDVISIVCPITEISKYDYNKKWISLYFTFFQKEWGISKFNPKLYSEIIIKSIDYNHAFIYDESRLTYLNDRLE